MFRSCVVRRSDTGYPIALTQTVFGFLSLHLCVGLVLGVVVEGIAVGLSYASFRGYSAWTVDSAGVIRRALSIGLPVTGLGTALALYATGLTAAEGAALKILVLSTGGYLATLAGYAGTLPAEHRIRGITPRGWVHVGQFAAFTASAVAVTDVVLVSLTLGSTWVAVATVCAVALAFYLVADAAVFALSETRSPTTAETAKLTAVDSDHVIDQTHILRTGGVRWPGAFVRGPPWSRTLFVSSTLLETYPPESVSVVVAVSLERARQGYFATKVAATTALGICLVYAARGELFVAVIALIAYLGGCTLARQRLFDADRAVSRDVDLGVVIETHRRITEDADTALDAGGFLRNALRGRASRARRIAHLRGHDCRDA